MKKLFFVLTVVMLLSLGLPFVASAGNDGPRGCPNEEFMLHEVSDHDQHHDGNNHMHRHIGLRVGEIDKNGDGYICVKHLPDNKHLHIDNNKPLKNK